MSFLRKVTDGIFYIGASDKRIQLFENLFPVPGGVSYNSYLISDEKTAVLDGADESVLDEYLKQLSLALDGRKLDYIVVNHMEPDHSGAISELIYRYPDAKLVGNVKTQSILASYLGEKAAESMLVVADGDTLELGSRTLKFVFTPMVHWPESMMCYELSEGILFSQDAFGSFGSVDGNIFDDETEFGESCVSEMRRYYSNIVGKYGAQVSVVLKKAAGLKISMICPLHGLILRSRIAEVLELYGKWSDYIPEKKGVLIAYASMYGNVKRAAFSLAAMLADKGVKDIQVTDVSKTDVSYLVSSAFRFSHIAVASVTYNAALYPKMEYFMRDLKALNLQNRAFAFIEGGSWAPASGKAMRECVCALKNSRAIGDTVSVKGASVDFTALEKLAEEIAADIKA